MKLSTLACFSLGILAANAGWDCDQRCPGYNACVQQNKNSRLLVQTDDPSMIEDIHGNATWPIRHSTKHTTALSSSSSSSTNLRGTDMNNHRKLEELLVFQLELHWTEGACWQEEWEKRDWCLRCQGDSCNEDDYLIIDHCSGSSRQKFIYRPVEGTGGGKIMPLTKPHLCWTRTRVNAHQLQPCGDGLFVDDLGRDVQIIIGFDPDGPSELHPNGITDKCMDNHHHPKAEELIRAGRCDEARRNKTSKWLPINKSTVNLDSPPPVETGPSTTDTGTGVQQRTEAYDGDFPPVKPLGKEYCDEHLCGLCEGDCDSDDQCEGHLKCFQRDGGQTVPGCSGGEHSKSKTDYCYDPNFESQNGSQVEELPEIDFKGSEYCSPSNKCGVCQGDCDKDEDCATGLICHQRGKLDPIPGCEGHDSSKSDYCVLP